MNTLTVPIGCYLLGGESGDDFCGKTKAITGLFTPLHGSVRRVRLSRVFPKGRLGDLIERSSAPGMLVGDCELVLLNGIENEVGSYFVADVTLEKIERRTDSIGSVDLTLTLDCDTIHPEAEWSWILVCSGNLVRTGMWHRLSQQGRDAWLSVALNHHGYRKASSARLHAVYEMDGRYITDETSFFCSLGELINGPGGYFGWNLSALEDCLNGGWGAASPFQLKWHHSEESRFRIARDERLVREYEGRFLEYLDDIFARHRIEIVLL